MKTLRSDLQGAIHQRSASLRNGRCQRKDHTTIWVSIGKAQAFLNSYPVADDARVRAWCLAHHQDLGRIVPANSPRTLARLLMEALKPIHAAYEQELLGTPSTDQTERA